MQCAGGTEEAQGRETAEGRGREKRRAARGWQTTRREQFVVPIPARGPHSPTMCKRRVHLDSRFDFSFASSPARPLPHHRPSLRAQRDSLTLFLSFFLSHSSRAFCSALHLAALGLGYFQPCCVSRRIFSALGSSACGRERESVLQMRPAS